ncbi:phospholipase D-like domain-containing protein, partial [Klebsiella pneumoniae]
QAYPSVSQVSLQLIPSAPELTGHVIYETLVCAIFAAKKQVVITTPYFVPDDALLLAITTAAKRGVKVILNVPKKVDSLLV